MNKLKAVPWNQVRIRDRFWEPRREINRRISLYQSLDMLEREGNVQNLELAASGAREGFRGPVFMDSDLYKTVEAVAFSLGVDPDPELERRIDVVIEKIATAQAPDGYLNTYYQVKEPDRRWTNLRDHHELYCAGHLFEAAVVHYQATGKRALLDVAIRFADHIDERYGEGKQPGYPGHPEIELALIKLWRVTGERRYFELSRFFVDHRGSHFFAREHGTAEDRYDGAYWQDHRPIREHESIEGHAVRAGYLYSAVVEVAAVTGDRALLEMTGRVWENATQKRLYVTGGIGPSSHNEGFTTDYDLPNLSAYQETCATISLAMWAHRLNLLYADGVYADFVEQALYNGVLSGVSLDGSKFFYVNPLSSVGNHHRSEWFGCACCPPNLARTLASLGGYAYAVSEGEDPGLWVNLYLQGQVETGLNGQQVRLDVVTDYPWDGSVRITIGVQEQQEFALNLRVPSWCAGASVNVNGTPVSDAAPRSGYLAIRRAWSDRDVVEMNLPMLVRRIEANPEVKDDLWRMALARGPLIYCIEGCDQQAPLGSIGLPLSSHLQAAFDRRKLGGVVTISGVGEISEPWRGGLYRPAEPPRATTVTAIPYYAWDNRGPGEMRVWIPVAPAPPGDGGAGR